MATTDFARQRELYSYQMKSRIYTAQIATDLDHLLMELKRLTSLVLMNTSMCSLLELADVTDLDKRFIEPNKFSP